MDIFRDRIELLQSGLLKHHGICAEVGVCEGVFSKLIWDITKPHRLHLIDVWAAIGACGAQSGTDGLHRARMMAVSRLFNDQIKTGQVVIHQGLSRIVLNSLEPCDWIYVDGDHSREGVLGDLYSARSGLQDDGLLAGHDLVEPNESIRVAHYFPGVKEAVDFFCKVAGWEMIAKTQIGPAEEPDRAGRSLPSYVLRRRNGSR